MLRSRDSGADEHVLLQVEDLGAVGFRHAHVADKRGERGAPQTVVFDTPAGQPFLAPFHVLNLISFSMFHKWVGCGRKTTGRSKQVKEG
jgi:hypothetical protein